MQSIGLSASNVIPIREADDEELPLVTPGEYLATYVRHAGVVAFGSAKLRLDMRLIAHPDIVLSRWYQVSDYRGGRVKASRHRDIVREVSAVLGRRVRWDRIPVNALQGMLVRVLVSTVTHDHRQERLAEINCYSRIKKLIDRVEP
jgi:hypothetical protein